MCGRELVTPVKILSNRPSGLELIAEVSGLVEVGYSLYHGEKALAIRQRDKVSNQLTKETTMTVNSKDGGSGAAFSCQQFVINNPGNLRKLDKVTNPLKTLKDVDLYLGGDTIVCLECGRDFKALAAHLNNSHRGLSSADYKKKYNIPYGRGLICEDLRARKSRIMKARLKDPDIKAKLLKDGRMGADLITGRAANRKYSALNNNNNAKVKEGQKLWALERHNKVRPKWIMLIKLAIESKCRLHEIDNKASRDIQRWLSRHPEDKEMSELYKLIRAGHLPVGVHILPSGRYRAVTWDKADKKFIGHGTFATIKEAEQARKTAKYQTN